MIANWQNWHCFQFAIVFYAMKNQVNYEAALWSLQELWDQ